MAREKKITSYGLREVSVAGLTRDNDEGVEYTELTRCWGAQESSVDVEVSEEELRGDDGVLEIDSNISSVDFSFSNAIMTFESLKNILGGAINDILDENNKKIGKKYSLTGGAELPYFGLVARTEKTGSLKVILPKCKATGGVSFSFADEDYCIVEVDGAAVMREWDEGMMTLAKYDKTNQADVKDLEEKIEKNTVNPEEVEDEEEY